MSESEDRFRAILEHAPVMIDAFDADGRVDIWNRECERRLGWTAEEVGAMDDPLAIFYPVAIDRAKAAEAIERADGEFREYRVHAKDGSTRLQRWADFALPNGSRISVGYDVTEQRRTEASLREAQKIQALGTLSAGIAHDFNNLLTIISCSGVLAQRDVERAPESARHFLQEILDAADRGADLIRRLMSFGRRGGLRRRPVILDEALKDFGPTLRRVLPESIALEVVLEAGTSVVLADPTAIQQVVVNLVNNSRDAIEGQGTIRIETCREGGEVVLAVSDSGCGMAPEVRERLFEPFFTTKAPGQGTGLGLSMVHGLVREHEGTVSVASEPGQGTTVTIRLPFHPESTDDAPAESAPEEGRGETILLVEDDHAVAVATSRCLQRAGFVVLTAADGEEALATLEDEAVDLILSDVVMPVMGGVELGRRVREGPHADVPIVFMSGYSPDIGELDRLLPKPWTPDQLVRFVRESIDDE